MLHSARRDFVPEQVEPNLVGTNQISPGLGPWLWGAEVQLTAALPNNFLLCGLQVYEISSLPNLGTVSLEFELRVGTGALGALTPIAYVGSATIATNPPANLSAIFIVKCWTDLVGPYPIPAGTRVAVQAALNGPIFAMRYGVALLGYNMNTLTPESHHPQPDLWRRGISANMASRVVPSAARVTVPAVAAAWGWGPWTQIAAALPRDTLIAGIAYGDPSGNGRQFQVELGLGAPAAPPVAFGACKLPGVLPFPFPSPVGHALLPRPWLAHAGETISARIANNVAVADTWDLTLLERPLQ